MNQSRIQNLRFLSLRLEVSGTAAVVNNTKLYQGGFGFVQLQVFVPVTPQARGRPLLTVFRTTIDQTGMRRSYARSRLNMRYVEDVTLDGIQFMLFERPLPASFTDTVGDLELTFNYTEFDEDNRITASMVTNLFRTHVSEGGFIEEDVNLGQENELLATQVNANTVAIDMLWGELESLDAKIDSLDLDEIFAMLAELERVKNEILEQLEILGEYKQELFALVENLELRLTARIALLEGRATALESKTANLTAATNALSTITDSLIEQGVSHQLKIDNLEVKTANLSANLDLEAERLTAFKQSTYKSLDGINADVRQAKTDINRNRFEINQLRHMFGEIVDTLGLPITVGEAADLGLTVGQVAAQNWTVAEVAVFGQARLQTISINKITKN